MFSLYEISDVVFVQHFMISDVVFDQHFMISDLSGSMKGQNFIGKVIKVAAVGVEKKEGGINVGS